MWTFKIKFKPSTEEYVVRFYFNGIEHKPARYYATDRQEANETGKVACHGMNTTLKQGER